MTTRQADSDNPINEVASDIEDLKTTVEELQAIHRLTSIPTRSTASRTLWTTQSTRPLNWRISRTRPTRPNRRNRRSRQRADTLPNDNGIQ